VKSRVLDKVSIAQHSKKYFLQIKAVYGLK